MVDRAGGGGHWDGVYSRVPVDEVSWFQTDPVCSLSMLDAAAAGPADGLVDVGGGASVLVDRLLDAGWTDVTVLDVAEQALAVSRRRLAERADQAVWVVADLLDWRPPRRYRVWHDRAVFHFLTDPADRDRYRAVLHAALAPGGHAVVGTFAADGPQRCSGLPTARYGRQELADQFPGFRVVAADREEHHTPGGGVQPFTWLLFADER